MIEIEVPDGISGDWKVETFVIEKPEISEMLSLVKYGRGVPPGTYKRLCRRSAVIMSNTPDEIRDFRSFVWKAEGSVLVNGLGLGVLLKALLDKVEVTSVRVVEKSADVINLVADTYLKDSRVEIIHADAFEYKSPKGTSYNAVWHDIWDTICADNLPEMHTLHRKYGRSSHYQESWCRWRCEQAKKQETKNYAGRFGL